MTERIHAFDWLRGLAVLFMLQTHALSLVSPAARATPLFAQLVRVDGLVAPSFLFSAGFALALVQVRAAVRQQQAASLRKSLRRVGEVVLVASLVNAIWFPVPREPRWLLRLDILQCIALSLMAVLAVLAGLAQRPRVVRWVCLVVALLVFSVAPLLEPVTGWWSLFVNTRTGVLDATTGATFPLFPWAGFVFLGASFGATVGAMRHERELWGWWGLLVALGAGLWANSKQLAAAYPPHQFWVTNPANCAQRWTLVLLVVGALRALEVAAPRVAQLGVFRKLAAFGVTSLSAYVIHEMLLFHHRFGVFNRAFHERADWPLFWVLLVALIVATWWGVAAWAGLEAQLKAAWARWLRPAS